MEQAISKQHILNYLDFNLARQGKIPLIDYIYTVNSYELLGASVPNKDRVVSYLNSLQTKERTWNTGKEHYIPTTAQILMTYARWGITPLNSLQPFFSATNTWEKAVVHVKKYTPNNYWGGLWGYVACYTSQGRIPSWKEEFLKELDEKFETWSVENHQRTHVVATLLQLGEPVPRLKEIARITIEQQKKDGRWEDKHWNKPLPQTAFGVLLLKTAEKRLGMDVEETIIKAYEFIRQCYKTKTKENIIYAGFSMSPEKGSPVEPISTGLGVAILLSGEKYLQWLGFKEGI